MARLVPRLSGSLEVWFQVQLIWTYWKRLPGIEQLVEGTPVHEVCADESRKLEGATHGFLERCGHAENEESDERNRDLNAHGILGYPA
jgi:hypothetical protein